QSDDRHAERSHAALFLCRTSRKQDRRRTSGHAAHPHQDCWHYWRRNHGRRNRHELPVRWNQNRHSGNEAGSAGPRSGRHPQKLRKHCKRGRMTTEQVEDAMGLLSGTLDYADLAACDLVIEAVYENMDVKKEVFAKLDSVVKQGAILASNTSYLNIDEIATATKRPEYVLGLHFFKIGRAHV